MKIKPHKILYLGDASGTSFHRYNALLRLGCNVQFIDPTSFIPKTSLLSFLRWKLGIFFYANYVTKKIIEVIEENRFDIVIINQGELVEPSLVKKLKDISDIVVNYNNDDPFGNRDGKRWDLYLKAVPFYDMLVVVREANVSEAYAKGARKVLRVFMSADEVIHAPIELTEEDIQKWSSEVLFVGTWMPERGELMAKLIEAGIPLTIYGGRWNKAKEWNLIKKSWKGQGLYGTDYTKAIQTAKVCLGLLSKGNRDLHTQRSIEIPHIGSLLCAEYTDEHLKLYLEDEEAVFWKDPDDCIQKCNQLLDDDCRRLNISRKGHLRCLQNKLGNESVMSEIMSQAFDLTEKT